MIRYSIHLKKSQLDTLKKLNKSQFDTWEEVGESFVYRRQLRSTDHTRRLYGIVGFWSHKNWMTGHTFYNFFIPSKNENALNKALNNEGIFSKELKEEDLPVLDFIYQKNKELRKNLNFKYPRFTIKEIHKNTKLKKDLIRESLDRLTGVLCLSLEGGHSEHYDKDGDWGSYKTTREYWLLHTSKNNLVENLLYGVKKNGRNYEVDFQ